jgi:hypothetical protein
VRAQRRGAAQRRSKTLRAAARSRALRSRAASAPRARAAVYEPVAWLAKGVQYELFGLNPKGFVACSLLLHFAARHASRALRPAALSIAPP